MSKIPTDFIRTDRTRTFEAKSETIFRKQARIAKYGQVNR